ncbi:hypothetical protein GPJ56_008880 [Histomonas meleagridis]|uniref:uncharacterized protein n=1 Tax=Histomonas meleagridis TaxID=135588 RepID=UPI003559B643|nr:hypothetical protein GPJ56_008880 [Histomonas meleagridis]KAH0797806.1 hypothetical protein GO595_009435 [Histomonas meleagridis]
MSENTEGSSQLLEQAIRSGDQSLMSFVLKKPQEEIPLLVNQMQPNLISPFLKTFTHQIQSYPNTLESALSWIDAFIDRWKDEISASAEYQRKVSDLQKVLKDRTQQIGILIEIDALSNFVAHEKEGAGIGLPINDLQAQTLSEE